MVQERSARICKRPHLYTNRTATNAAMSVSLKTYHKQLAHHDVDGCIRQRKRNYRAVHHAFRNRRRPLPGMAEFWLDALLGLRESVELEESSASPESWRTSAGTISRPLMPPPHRTVRVGWSVATAVVRFGLPATGWTPAPKLPHRRRCPMREADHGRTISNSK